MQRPLSTRAHGVMDYTWSAAAAAVPHRMENAPRTRALMRASAAAGTAYAAVTDYECGLFRMMPMRTHLAIDFAMSAVLLAAPLFLPASERRYAAVPVAFGVVGLVTGLLTDPRRRRPAQLRRV